MLSDMNDTVARGNERVASTLLVDDVIRQLQDRDGVLR